ncbi:hypothetical protein CSIM01_02368 [Colletotrichum simmondsii]|uniref:Nephrocystin 3-like N-terminal domain-containing protein n=1 Tax=Colletotrichum simmondsii TaxID=703756 RepID=A0A135SDQ3_9PEZI|nr:hypothetical protein CSIM01_02368 [Colletotrichum simmondsii]
MDRLTPGTGEWLFRNQRFLDWKTSFGSLLWLDGIIGAGKSVLSSIIVHHLEDSRNVDEPSACIYIYFHDDDESQPTLASLYAGLLEQLLRRLEGDHVICDSLRNSYKKSKDHGASLSHDDYFNLLATQGQAFTKVYLIVDGFDTHYNTRNPQIQDQFIKGVRQLTNWCLLMTSRLGTFTRGRRESDLELIIQATATDIGLYVDMRVEGSGEMLRLTREGSVTDVDFRKHISTAIAEKAQGVFLLAKMHMDNLVSQEILGDFKIMLKTLPESREKTFDAALQRVQRQEPIHRERALHVLTWVAFAMQPVTPSEVSHAFAVHKHAESLDKEFLANVSQLTSPCAGIVVVDQQSGLLRSAHDAVLRHVRQSGYLPNNPHRNMALQCLSYLTFGSFNDVSIFDKSVSESTRDFPLLEYAAKHWYSHYHRAQPCDVLEERVLHFLENENCTSFSFHIRNPVTGKGVSGLHACAFLGADQLAKKLIQRGMSVHLETAEQQKPLHWAARSGNLAIARLLREHEASLDAQDRQGNTPLHLAVCHDRPGEHGDMVSLLIQMGARVDLWSTKGFTPLRWCLKYGLTDRATPLIHRKAELDVEDKDGWTPMRWAAWYRRSEMVRLMVKNGYDINHRAKDGWNILQYAAQYGDESLTIFLLDNDIEVDLRDQEEGLTPLQWAIMHSNTSVAKLLLDNGANVNVTCKGKLTPLMQATRGGNKEAVWLLLGHKPTMDAQEEDGNTALHFAVRHGHKALVWILVEEGASLNIQEVKGRTPLHRAVANNDLPLVWYLTLKGANVSLADVKGREPLHLAARQGQEKAVDLLLERGANINNQDGSGLTPLHHAASSGQHNVASFLMNHGAQLDVLDQAQNSALNYATRLGFREVVHMLLDGGAQTSLQDTAGLTALHHAACLNNEMIVQELLNYAAQSSIQDKKGLTALHHAASLGHEQISAHTHSNQSNK